MYHLSYYSIINSFVSGSWVVGKPELLADCLSKYSNVENYALNPSLDETYSTINGIMSDLVAAQKPYNTKYIHMGGDEVIYGCWKNDASITSFMLENGISSYDDMLGYFVNRTDVMLQDNISDPDSDEPVTLIHWEEVFFAGATVPSNTIFQVWTDASKMVSSTFTSVIICFIASPPVQISYKGHICVIWNVSFRPSS